MSTFNNPLIDLLSNLQVQSAKQARWREELSAKYRRMSWEACFIALASAFAGIAWSQVVGSVGCAVGGVGVGYGVALARQCRIDMRHYADLAAQDWQWAEQYCDAAARLDAL